MQKVDKSKVMTHKQVMRRKLFILTFALIVLGGFGLNSLSFIIYLIRDAFHSPQTELGSQEKNVSYLQKLEDPSEKPFRFEQASMIPSETKRSYLEPAEPNVVRLKGNGIVSVEIGGFDSSSYAFFMAHGSTAQITILEQDYSS